MVDPPAVADQPYAERLVSRVLAACDQGRLPGGQYGAVLIDEAHDFSPDWLRLATRMVNPDTGILLVLYDDAPVDLPQR